MFPISAKAETKKSSRLLSNLSNRKGCGLVDYRADKDHNRLVVSLVGQPDLIQLWRHPVAIEKIDLERHQGVIRASAPLTIPFIPIQNIDMKGCVNLVHTSAAASIRQPESLCIYEEAA
jgi:glutamate formiminotransferase